MPETGVNTRRKLQKLSILSSLLMILFVFVTWPSATYLGYAFSSRAQEIMNGEGRRVRVWMHGLYGRYRPDPETGVLGEPDPVEGVLESARIRFNDKFGWMDLQVSIRRGSRQTMFGLQVFDLWRLAFLDPPPKPAPERKWPGMLMVSLALLGILATVAAAVGTAKLLRRPATPPNGPTET